MVYKGKLQRSNADTQENVAIKTTKSELNNFTPALLPFPPAALTLRSELKAFLEESLLMKDFDHPNLLNLVGVCFDTPDGVPFIILPLMANGSLKDYLQRRRTTIKTVNLLVDTLPEVG